VQSTARGQSRTSVRREHSIAWSLQTPRHRKAGPAVLNPRPPAALRSSRAAGSLAARDEALLFTFEHRVSEFARARRVNAARHAFALQVSAQKFLRTVPRHLRAVSSRAAVRARSARVLSGHRTVFPPVRPDSPAPEAALLRLPPARSRAQQEEPRSREAARWSLEIPMPPAKPNRIAPSAIPPAWNEQMRREVTETALHQVSRVVEQEVRRQTRLDSREVRRLSEALYSDLGSRLVFERERLGRI